MPLFRKLEESLFKNFAVYLGSSIINKAIPFFLLPLLTSYLTPEEYGILAIFQVMISFGLPVIGMNMQNNITRNFFQKSKQYVASLVYNLLLVLLASTTIFLIGLSIYLWLGGQRFSIPERWLYVLPIIVMMNMVNEFNLTLLRNKKQAFEYGFFEILKTVLDLSLTVVLIVIYLQGWEGRASGILFSTVVVGCVALFRLWQNDYIYCRIDIIQVKQILIISLPLIPHALGNAIIALSDRLFVNQMVGTSAVGIYTVGYQFGMIMTLIIITFNRIWSPWMYELLAKNKVEDKKLIVRYTYLVGGSYMIIAGLITIVSYFLLPLMTVKAYHKGINFVIWIAMGYAFNGMYTLVFPYAVHVGKTSFLGISTLLAAIINLAGNYFLIKSNGAVGAAQATLISYIFMFLSVWYYSNRIFPMPWFGSFKR